MKAALGGVLDLGCVCVHVRLGGGSEKAPPRKEEVGFGEGTKGAHLSRNSRHQGENSQWSASRSSPGGNNLLREAVKGSRPCHGGLEFYPTRSNWWRGVGVETGIGFWRDLS